MNLSYSFFLRKHSSCIRKTSCSTDDYLQHRNNIYDSEEEFWVVIKETGKRQESQSFEEMHEKQSKACQFGLLPLYTEDKHHTAWVRYIRLIILMCRLICMWIHDYPRRMVTPSSSLPACSMAIWMRFAIVSLPKKRWLWTWVLRQRPSMARLGYTHQIRENFLMYPQLSLLVRPSVHPC